MVIMRPEETQPPWVSARRPIPAKRAPRSWRTPCVVVGRNRPHGGRGGGRVGLAAALAGRAAAGAGAVLLLPEDAFPPPYASLVPALRGAWKNGPAAASVDAIGRRRDRYSRHWNSSSWSVRKGPRRCGARAGAGEGAGAKGKLLAILSLGAPLPRGPCCAAARDGILAG